MIFFQHWFVQKRLNREKVESTKVQKNVCSNASQSLSSA